MQSVRHSRTEALLVLVYIMHCTLSKTNYLMIQLPFIAVEIRRFALVAMLLLIEHNCVVFTALY